MRPSSIAFAIALAVALPSGAALLPHVFAPWVYPALLGFGFGVGLAAMAALDFADFWRGRAVELADLSARTEAVRLGNWERELRLAAVADGPAVAAPPVDHWRTAAHRFLTAGNQYGFSIRVLVGKQIVTWDDWGRMVDCLTVAGVMVARPRAGWAEGWDMARWLSERHSTPLPHPDGEPPSVELAPQQQRNNGATPAPASRAVVDQ